MFFDVYCYLLLLERSTKRSYGDIFNLLKDYIRVRKLTQIKDNTELICDKEFNPNKYQTTGWIGLYVNFIKNLVTKNNIIGLNFLNSIRAKPPTK